MNKILKTMMLAAVTAFGLASCEDVPAPFIEPEKPGTGEVIGAEGNGTLEKPFNVAAVIKYVQDLGADVESPEKVYIKGIVCSTKEISAQFGNATFDISADGELAGEKFTVYRAKGLNNQNIKSEDDVQVGDEVIVYGNVVNYKGNTPETTQGKAYIHWQKRGDTVLDGSAPDTPDTPADGGTWDKPYTVAQAIANQTGKEVWVHGYIVGSIPADVSSFVLENMTFTADGASGTNICIADVHDETNYANCAPVQLPAGSDARTDLNLMNNPSKLGVKVWLKGKATTYFGAPGLKEISKYTLTAPTAEDDQAPSEEPTEDPKGDGSLENPYNVSAVLSLYAKGNPEGQSVYVKGKISKIKSLDVSQWERAQYFISDDGTENAQFQIYNGYYLDGKPFTSNDQIKVGDEVIVYGELSSYQGTPQIGQNSKIVSINGQTGDGDTPGDDEGEGDQEDDDQGNAEDFSISMMDLYSEVTTGSVDAGSKTYNGVTFTFEQNGGNNMPKYYWNANDAYKAVRMYALNKMKIQSGNKIEKVILICNDASGSTLYNGNKTATVTAGTLDWADDNKTVTINDINSNVVELVNLHSANSGGVQIRIHDIKIYYAK